MYLLLKIRQEKKHHIILNLVLAITSHTILIRTYAYEYKTLENHLNYHYWPVLILKSYKYLWKNRRSKNKISYYFAYNHIVHCKNWNMISYASSVISIVSLLIVFQKQNLFHLLYQPMFNRLLCLNIQVYIEMRQKLRKKQAINWYLVVFSVFWFQEKMDFIVSSTNILSDFFSILMKFFPYIIGVIWTLILFRDDVKMKICYFKT